MEEPHLSPHQAIRDLAWVIGSPPLLDIPQSLFSYDEMQAEYAQQKDWLTQLSHNPAPLQAHLAQLKRRTLGSYFELLMAFWLKHRKDTTLLASNLQIQQGKSTVGEIDFIVKMQNITVHIEAAVKFYLGCDNQRDWHHWLGPTAHDRLDIKMASLLSRQLLLPHHPAGIVPDISRIFLKGYFFTHYNHRFISPLQANPRHNTGWWCRKNELQDMLNKMECSYRWDILPREHWLSPACYENDTHLYDAASLLQLLQRISPSKQALLLVAVRADTQGKWHEISRILLVEDSWPEG